jgi:GTP-binding protein HflX
LRQALSEIFASSKVRRRCYLTSAQSGMRAKLFTSVKILSEQFNDEGEWEWVVEIERRNLGLLKDVRHEAC